MNIESYSDLIQAAAMQDEPQRLLFVFAKAELPNGYTDTQKHNFDQGQGGALAQVSKRSLVYSATRPACARACSHRKGRGLSLLARRTRDRSLRAPYRSPSFV